MKEKMREPKDITKQVRLIMNLIAPDTFDKKEQEIKDLMFKEADEVAGEESKKTLTIDDENLTHIVMTLFRKAQAERDYGRMYAQLCQNLIKEELNKMGETKVTRATIKKSDFRRSLLQNCRSSFNKLFMSQEEFNAQ